LPRRRRHLRLGSSGRLRYYPTALPPASITLTTHPTGYDNEILTTATTDANQDAKQGTVVYDAIYNCYPDGEIVWSVWCGGGGTCDKQASKSAHALCKGEPVDTGNQAPSYDDGEGEYYPPDEEYYP
jgi:hypothetical protein